MRRWDEEKIGGAIQNRKLKIEILFKTLNMNKLTHTDTQGRARMVDVGDKPDQKRIAKASGNIRLAAETVQLIHQNALKKGDVLTVAEIAGVQAAKRTSELIPLCHNIPLSKITVVATLTPDGVSVSSEVHSNGQTGVEMEALTAVSVALLTIYDMCKAVDKKMVMETITLTEKTKSPIQ
jgi:cyclic pyranopterin phosphate synthase